MERNYIIINDRNKTNSFIVTVSITVITMDKKLIILSLKGIVMTTFEKTIFNLKIFKNIHIFYE